MNKLTYLLLPLLLQSTMPVLGAEDSPLANSSSSSRRGGLHLDDLENDTNDAQADDIAIILTNAQADNAAIILSDVPGVSENSPPSHQSVLRLSRPSLQGSYDWCNNLEYEDTPSSISSSSNTNNRIVQGSPSISARVRAKKPKLSPEEKEKQEWLLASRILEPSANKASVFKEALQEQYDRIFREAEETLARQQSVDFSSVGVSMVIGVGSLVTLIATGFSTSTAIGGLVSGSAVPLGLQMMLNRDKIKNADAMGDFDGYVNFKEKLLEQTFNRYKNILNFFNEKSVKRLAIIAMQQMAYYAHQPSEELLKQLHQRFRRTWQVTGKNLQDVIQCIFGQDNSDGIREVLTEWTVRFFMNGLLRKPYYNKFKTRFSYSLKDPYEIVRILKKHNRYKMLRMEIDVLLDPFLVIAGQSLLYKEPTYKKVQPQQNFIAKLLKTDKDRILRTIGQSCFESGEIKDSNKESISNKIFFIADGFDMEYDEKLPNNIPAGASELLNWNPLETYKEQKIAYEEIGYNQIWRTRH